MTKQPTKAPAHLNVYQSIRQMIICGDLAPGQAVTIQGLVATLGAGMTPVREAIRRLTSEGALEFQGNRRVIVPVLTTEQIDELIFARLAIEPKLAFWATSKASPSDITELQAIDSALDTAISHGNVQQYMIQNHSFHMKLYSLAGTEIILPVVQGLWLRSAPSLRVMCGRFGTRNLPDMHNVAIQGLRDNDPDVVEDAIAKDILQGMENVQASLRGEFPA